MKKIKKCPCIECACRPICKHKDYPKLIKECDIVWEYISAIPYFSLTPKSRSFAPQIKKVFDVLQPTAWELDKEEKWREHAFPVNEKRRK